MKLCTNDGSVTCSCSATFASIIELVQKGSIVGQTVFNDINVILITCPICLSTVSLDTPLVVNALMKRRSA